jgi:glutathione reductase (NADPH)
VERYDYDLFIIGAGSAGVRAARVAAGYGARVAVAEGDRVGGTCVIRGCVPKKLFIHSAHCAEVFEDAVGLGWRTEGVRFDWPTLRDNVAADVTWLSGIYTRNLEKAGAELIASRAVLEDPHHVRLEADGRVVSARYVLIATGGHPDVNRSIPGIEHTVTSDEMFRLDKLPKRQLIIGGGYVAAEFASAFNAFGSETTLLHRGPEILRNFDVDIQKAVHAGMEKRGVTIATSDGLAAVEAHKSGKVAITRSGDRLDADVILMAIGRSPNSAGLGLADAGVKVDPLGAVVVDEYSRTSVDNIYAVGDVTNRLQLTPVAIREGSAFATTVFGGKPTPVDHADIPTALFSIPEAGTVGLSEEAAKLLYPALDIYRSVFKPLPNRVARRDERMLIKLVVDADTDRVLGCHFVGPSAAELVQAVAIAVKMGATKADFDATTALHPTLGEEIVTIAAPAERYRREAAAE